MKSNMLNKVSLAVHRAGFALRRRSPEILLAAGIVGTVVSAAMACKATTKLSGILEPAKSDIEKIRKAAEDGYVPKPSDPDSKVEYTQEDGLKDLAITYIQTGVKVIRLYAPALGVGALSVTGILLSHNILRKRGVALAAAYAAVDRSFRLYRSRVVGRYGERADHELKHGIQAVEVTERVEGEDGEETTVKKTVDAIEPFDPERRGEYTRLFDENSKAWEPDGDYNMMFLRAQQQYANDLLKARGHLFLNEVYDMLGLAPTPAGQSVGWVYEPENPVGDNFVDFGITEVHVPSNGGYIERILLDFNVDGPIMERVNW